VTRHPEDTQPRWVVILHGRVGKSRVGEMDMAVDQSWCDRRVREIDPLRVRGSVDAGSDSADAVTLDEHGTRMQHGSTLTVDERAGRDEDRARVAQGEREV
jgi:hypothetical protein